MSETPRPQILRKCWPCGVYLYDVDKNLVVVSPRGTAHFGEDYGVTRCGKDATGDKWWWPL